MAESSDYRKAYEAAQRELNDLLSDQQKLERRIVTVRQSLQTLATLCEEEGIEVKPSSDAEYLLEKSTLADEIRSILIAEYPGWQRPNVVKEKLERLGHDLTKYSNPQATIHMILKRMVEAGEAQETEWPPDKKKIYRIPRNGNDWTQRAITQSIQERLRSADLYDMTPEAKEKMRQALGIRRRG